MSLLRRTGGFLMETLQTLLRVLPVPTRKGRIGIGNPGRDSPVLLTGNYRLTVSRVRRALQGLNVHLLVADSRGINVWCAAAGGHFTDHDVIAALKVSGIGSLVDHRRVILPQLAATGIDGRHVREATGWKVLWGPVRARDLPAFLSGGCRAAPGMRTVDFPWPARMEMAAAWAFPISLLALLLIPFWPQGVLPVAALVWTLAFVVFSAFPLLFRRNPAPEKRVGFVLFDFGPHGALLIAWGLFLLGLAAVAVLQSGFSWEWMARWSAASFLILLILGLDLMGSTPTLKSGLHEERRFAIRLDPAKCRGAGWCLQVCPKNVFTFDTQRRLAVPARADECVQCGACIVQCPCDALEFQAPDGGRVPPAAIRKFKLNLLGRRMAPRDPAG